MGPGPHGHASTWCNNGSVGLLHVVCSPFCWHVGLVGWCVWGNASLNLQAMRKCSLVSGSICSTGVMSHAPAPGPPLELLTALWVVVIWSFTVANSVALIWVANIFCVSFGGGYASAW